LLPLLGILTLLAPMQGWPQKEAVQHQVARPVAEAIQIRQATQKDEVRWREERQRLATLYDQLQDERARLEIRRKTLEESLAAARERVDAKQAQIEAIERITGQVAPFLNEQYQRLADRIETDLPFLSAERRQRMENLQILLEDPGVAVSERLRKVFEALLVEAEYGNTIEVYQENIVAADRTMLANIFRLGRVGLYYQSLDRQACGFYNIAAGAWQPLEAGASRTLQTAMDIGTRRRPAEILNLPLGRIATP
jgi:hypothetical protein